MTRVDLDLAFNFDVQAGNRNDGHARMQGRDIEATEVYVDKRSVGCFFACETDDSKVTIAIPIEEIPELIDELEDHE